MIKNTEITFVIEEDMPKTIRLHIVKNELLTV